MMLDSAARYAHEPLRAESTVVGRRLDTDVQHAINTLRRRCPNGSAPLEPDEAAALGVLYRHYGGTLLGVARRLTTRRQDAEDVLHDVFCRLAGIVPSYRGGDFLAWIKRVTMRTALMRLRSQRRDRQTCDLDEAVVDGASVREESNSETEQHDLIRRAVRRLPASLRRVVVLRVVLNYSHREIANVLNITPCASEVRFCRAIKHLRFAVQGELRPEAAKTSHKYRHHSEGPRATYLAP